ncbi:MAG: CRISPR-associated endoribonuclease Cas6 [Campylobacterota bacterium]|nr:CRISPR-associated endoribonuclease Cas6 [Campylobacterota bacterium]
MKYFELTCTAYIKEDISFTQSFDILSRYISYSMAQDEELKKLHSTTGFKHYLFGGLLPIERDKIYLKGNTYKFVIRSLEKSFIDRLSTTLRANIDNPHLLIVETHKKTINQFFISELYSATPVIVTVAKDRYWVKEDDLMLLHKQLQDNLEKKYQEFYNEPIKSIQNFIQLFELKNNRLQTIQTNKTHSDGKPVKFYGNKFKIVPNEDEVSQKLAFVALACGLGEKNSFGGGFCLGRGMR